MPDPVPSVPDELVKAMARLIDAELEKPHDGRSDLEISEDAARAVLSAVSEAGWLYYEDDLNIAVEKAEEARAQAEALAETLENIAAQSDDGPVAYAAGRALRAFRESQEPDHAA